MIAVEKKVPYEKCEKCDRTAYQKAKEKCDNRKSQLEKKFKNMTTGYESILFLLAWYSITITLFTAILSPVFLNDCITFFGVLGKGMEMSGWRLTYSYSYRYCSLSFHRKGWNRSYYTGLYCTRRFRDLSAPW